MEELKSLFRELEDRKHELHEELQQVDEKLEEVETRIALEQMKNVDERTLEYYNKKLERLKKFVEEFRKESRDTNVHYAFEKMEEPYKGDFHEVIQEPLDYVLGEYDCLGMTKFLEIVFEYHSDHVKKFAEDWMKKNLPDSEPYQDKGRLYNRYFSDRKK